MNWATIQNAVRAAVITASGVSQADVFWRGQSVAGTMHLYPRVELKISNVTHGGVDEVRKTYNATPTPTRDVETVGNRRFTCSIRVESQNQGPGSSAPAIASQIRTRLRRPDVLTALRAAGVSLSTILGSVDADTVEDGRLVSVAITDVLFLAAEIDTGTAESGSGWIETAEGTAEFDGRDTTF